MAGAVASRRRVRALRTSRLRRRRRRSLHAAPGGLRAAGKRYGFNCGYCSSPARSDRIDGGPGRPMPHLRQHDHHPDPRPLRPADRSQDAADHQAGPAPGSRLRRRRRAAPKIFAQRRRQAEHPVPAVLRRSARSPPTTARAAACRSRWKARRWKPRGRATGFAWRRWCWGSSAMPAGCLIVPPAAGDHLRHHRVQPGQQVRGAGRRQGDGDRGDYLRVDRVAVGGVGGDELAVRVVWFIEEKAPDKPTELASVGSREEPTEASCVGL